MSFVPFRCGLNAHDAVIPNTTAALCFNGAICRVDVISERQFCECPKGYVHDYTAGHFPNCAMPDYIWSVMTGIVTVVTVLSLLISVQAVFDLRGQVRNIMIFGCAAMVANLAMMIATLADGGAFVPTIVCLYLFLVMTYRTVMTAIVAFTLPVYAVLAQNIGRFRSAVVAMETLNALGQLTAIIPMIMFARDEDPARYHSAMVVFVFIFFIGMISLGVLVVRQARRLKRHVDSVSANRQVSGRMSTPQDLKLNSLQEKMDMIVKWHGLLLAVFMLSWIFPTTLVVLGSFPYQFVLVFVMNLSVPIFAGVFAILYSQKERNSAQSRPSFFAVAAARFGVT